MSRPHKSETPLAGGVTQNENQIADAEIVADPVADCKRVATIKARFALAGHTVHECTTGGFLVSRWNLSRHCGDLDSLSAFLAEVERGQR